MLVFENPRIFCKRSANFCVCFCFTIYKEKMFTIEIEDGREAPKKPSVNKSALKKEQIFCHKT